MDMIKISRDEYLNLRIMVMKSGVKGPNETEEYAEARIRKEVSEIPSA